MRKEITRGRRDMSRVSGRALAVMLSFIAAALLFAVCPRSVYAAGNELNVVSVKADTLYGRMGAGDSFDVYGICTKDSSYRCYESQKAENGSVWYKVKDEKGSFFWLDSKYTELMTVDCGLIYSADSVLSRQVTPKLPLTLYTEADPISAPVIEAGTDCCMTVVSDGIGPDNLSWFRVVCGGKLGWVSREEVNIYNNFDDVAERSFSAERKPVIYLSPSNQAGNSYAAGDTNEHTQCQAIASELKKTLESRYNCTVYIADQKLSITASGRPAEAAALGADIYLAIHTNASKSTGKYGPQAYYFPGSDQSRRLSENLVEAMESISPFKSNVTTVINGMNYLGGYGYGEVRAPGALGMVPVLFEAEHHDSADSAQWIIDNTGKIAQAAADALNKTFSFPPAQAEESSETVVSEDMTAATETTAPAQTTAAAVVSATDAQAAETTTSTFLWSIIYDDRGEELRPGSAKTTQPALTTAANAPTTTPTTTATEPAVTEPLYEPAPPLTGYDLMGYSDKEFFDLLGPICSEDMAESGILASITLAQAAQESAFGQSELALYANNIFGMKQNLSGNKWKSVWKGDLYEKVTQEEQNGVLLSITAQFRAYETINAGVRDHGLYLTQAKLSDGSLRYRGLKGEKDYRKAAEIIAAGGYATDSQYSSELISLIERYGLTKYDEISVPTTSATVETTTTTTITTGVYITEMALSNVPGTMNIGDTVYLGLTVVPKKADESVSWSSSNTAIARVDASGKVIAVGAGTVRISAKSSKCEAVCDIVVKPDIDPVMLGAGICIAEPYGIRFATRIEKNTAWESGRIERMGTLIIPSSVLGKDELTIENEKALNVPATKKYSEDDASFIFTGKLGNIPEKSFDMKIKARSYVVYKNIDGSEGVGYSEVCESSFREVAVEALKIYEDMKEDTAERTETIEKLHAILGYD